MMAPDRWTSRPSGACASYCSKANTTLGRVANVVRERLEYDPSSRVGETRSGAQHMGNAKATSVMSGDLEFPLLGLEL